MMKKPPELKLIVFDIGNTLVNAEELINACARYAAKQMQRAGLNANADLLFDSYLEASKSLHHKHINRIFSDPLICAKALRTAHVASDEHNRYLLLTFFRRRLRQKLRRDESLIRSLNKLRARGFLLAALSDGTITEQYELLDRLGILLAFDQIRISESYGEEKQSVNIFSDLLADFGLDRDQALMVGDDLGRDMRWASQAGYRTVLQEEFVKHPASLIERFAAYINYRVNSISELCELVSGGLTH